MIPLLKKLMLFFSFFAALNATAQSLKVGQKVEVNYNGHWYKSVILKADGDRYRIHYDGYPASDDVWIMRSYIRTLGNDGAPAKTTCNFQPPPGNFTNRSPASEALFKRKLYDWYAMTVTGGLSAPKAVGIVFSSFSIGAGYTNTVTNVPGRGALRRHSGAPANAVIYPVKAYYFVCEQYNSGVSQKEVSADLSFYINKNGEWICSKDS